MSQKGRKKAGAQAGELQVAESEESVAEEQKDAADEAAVEETPSGESAEGEAPGAAETGLWPVERLRPVIEAIVFAAGDPLPAKKIVDFIEGSTIEEVKATLQELSVEYLTHGVRLIEVAGGWQMRTAPEHQRYVRKLFRERPQRLTRAQTETIAIVAYKQPVTRQEIESVRGVDSGSVLELLVERRLAKVVGRKDVPGRPLVYATTQDFLELFGLKSIRELPTLPELGHDFERMSEQGGFAESEDAAILPLEEDDAAVERTAPDASDAEARADAGAPADVCAGIEEKARDDEGQDGN